MKHEWAKFVFRDGHWDTAGVTEKVRAGDEIVVRRGKEDLMTWVVDSQGMLDIGSFGLDYVEQDGDRQILIREYPKRRDDDVWQEVEKDK